MALSSSLLKNLKGKNKDRERKPSWVHHHPLVFFADLHSRDQIGMTTTPVLSVATGGNYTAAHSYSTAVGCVQAIVQGRVSNKYFLWGIRVDGSQRPAWPSCFWRKSATSNFSLKLRKQHIPLVSGRGAEDSFFPVIHLIFFSSISDRYSLVWN